MIQGASAGGPRAWDLARGAEIVPGRLVLRRLGRGRRFEVYLAWDEGIAAEAVAKLVRPAFLGDPATLRQLRREGRILAALAHPSIVRVFDRAEEADLPHLLLEHAPGPTLRAAIRRRGPLPPEEVLRVGVEACAALVHVHSRGFVHLDVKPGNLVLSRPVRLIDFSIARRVERACRLAVPVGTPRYMAPEQCRPGPGGVGPPADVFGLGATLYHALTGEVPFPRDPRADPEDPAGRYPQLVREPRPTPTEIDPALGELVLSCLARHPDERPTAPALLAELRALAASRQALVPLPGLRVR